MVGLVCRRYLPPVTRFMDEPLPYSTKGATTEVFVYSTCKIVEYYLF